METADLTALLPEDVLAGVLRRLTPRGIVRSRCVCKAWRALIDAHPLPRAALLPRSLAGVLINFESLGATEFFSRPSADEDRRRRTSAGEHHHYLPGDCYDAKSSWRGRLQDHCNGLLYSDYGNCVLNPPTRWCALLPPVPAPARVGTEYHSFQAGHLVYDPTISLHYEVVLVQQFMCRGSTRPRRIKYDHVVEQSEWPPSPCVLIQDAGVGREVICQGREGCRDDGCRHEIALAREAQCRLLEWGALCALPNQFRYEVITSQSLSIVVVVL
jgi:hypothetical protein